MMWIYALCILSALGLLWRAEHRLRNESPERRDQLLHALELRHRLRTSLAMAVPPAIMMLILVYAWSTGGAADAADLSRHSSPLYSYPLLAILYAMFVITPAMGYLIVRHQLANLSAPGRPP